MVLVGCGTFDKDARARLSETRKRRIRDYLQSHPEHRADLDLSFEEQIFKWHTLTDTYEAVPDGPGNAAGEPFDMAAYVETWNDMLRCQDAGIYPYSFASITTPVIMLHGAYDPHPGRMIRDGLRQYLPHLEYREFERCGHDPWVEKHAREEFFEALRSWLRNGFGRAMP
jgi:pimeloyl-ACP methyl ester carboxylesterase